MIVVADTSVLINLCRVGQGALFQQLFHEMLIPPEVAAEFERLVGKASRFAGLKLPPGIKQQSPSNQPTAVRDATGLDSGEAAALSLAVEIHADAVLIDERGVTRWPCNLGSARLEFLASCCGPNPSGCCPP